jgi:hypothetical protein
VAIRQNGNQAMRQEMSGKRPSLAESMRQAAVGEAPTPSPSPLPTPPKLPERAAAAPTAKLTGRPPAFYAATRIGKKKVTAALNPAAHKQLKALAVEKEETTEALLTEAINDLFKKHGKPPIA